MKITKLFQNGASQAIRAQSLHQCMKPTDIWSPLPPTFLGSPLNQFLAGRDKTAKPAGLGVLAKRSFTCGVLDNPKQ